ncbi:hypothetical protein Agub_g10263 [Astrephomene gubernaculifera]|uniref:O-fucosyltransferase family protein n=1 Tax=Astrephomene gubernaculifera TaxID=47775 RepID=A0AAD3DV20_9CHLO|nr:hypothetical protein Agub_g10263 [Astrephomene gubernaculifera]
MSLLSRKISEDGHCTKRCAHAPGARSAIGVGLPVTRRALLAGFLVLSGYFFGAWRHACTGSRDSRLLKAVETVSPGPPSPDLPDPGSITSPRQPRPLLELPSSSRTLRFPVCNGFANQRLSMVYGIILAKRLGRAAVLPVLVDNGLQRTDSNVLVSDSNKIAFEEMYDLPYFNKTMTNAGVRLLLPSEAPPASSYTTVQLSSMHGRAVDTLTKMYGSRPHLAVDCPLFRLSGQELRPTEDGNLAWAVLSGLRPSKEAAEVVEHVTRAISNVAAAAARDASTVQQGDSAVQQQQQQRSAAGKAEAKQLQQQPWFNFLHLRIENDWLEHCKRWESIRDGIVRDNCYRHTEELGTRLPLFNVSARLPLYVASYWEDVTPELREKMVARLVAAGYQLVTSSDVFPNTSTSSQQQRHPGGTANAAATATDAAAAAAATAAAAGGLLASHGREYRAMIEYFVGMRAERFIGNSVSTFAALGLLERRHAGLWAAHYNGGNIPLASVLPALHRLPWVFTYNSWSPSYDYLARAAVRSALATRSLQPYCIFSGNTSSPIATWLAGQGVALISHEPVWRERLLGMAGNKAQRNVHHSPLFKSPDALVSTFQRVDLPVVPLLDQYTHVLYTDVDVYFRRPITLDDFGLPLPRSVSMSYEMDRMFPFNAGVIVANLPTMRQRYKEFIRMMLDNTNGLYYPNYGPADQGIINKFYEVDLRANMLSQAFNAKPYSAFDPAAFILHFHGPKPHDYASYLRDGKCEFRNLCEKSLKTALCKYVSEWQQWVPEDPSAVQLNHTCAMLRNPVFKRIGGVVQQRQLLGNSAHY